MFGSFLLARTDQISNNPTFCPSFQQPPRPARKHWSGRPWRASPSNGRLMDYKVLRFKIETAAAPDSSPIPTPQACHRHHMLPVNTLKMLRSHLLDQCIGNKRLRYRYREKPDNSRPKKHRLNVTILFSESVLSTSIFDVCSFAIFLRYNFTP